MVILTTNPCGFTEGLIVEGGFISSRLVILRTKVKNCNISVMYNFLGVPFLAWDVPHSDRLGWIDTFH